MPGRSRSRFRTWFRVPLAVVAASVAFGCLASVWSVVAPLGEAPDEPAHLGLVLYLADGHGYPEYDGLHSPSATFRLCATYAAATRACPRQGEEVTATSIRRHPAKDAPDKGTRPAWDDEGGAVPVGRVNQMPQHPPLYYQGMALVLKAERGLHGGPGSLDRELALLRLVNVLLVTPVPLLAWWAARRAGLDDLTGTTAALATLAFPMLTHIGSTLNNDNLLTLCGGVLVALLAGVLRGDRSWRTGLAVGAVTGLALLTKAFALVFPPVIVLAYLVGLREGRAEDDVPPRTAVRFLRPLALPVLVAGAATAVLSSWWYVGVRLRTGQFAPTTEDARLTSALAPPGFDPSPWEFLTRYARDLDQRFWGSFGWYSVRLSTGLTYLLTLVLVGLVGNAIVRGRRDESGPDRLVLFSLLIPMGALKLFVMQHAWTLYARTSKFQFIQGRYLLAGIVGLAVVAAVGVLRALGDREGLAPLAVGVAAVAVQGWALHRCLDDWWSGDRSAMTAWSGWPGEVVGVMCLALAASTGATLLALVLGSGSRVGSDDP